jgi:hypothetical protein
VKIRNKTSGANGLAQLSMLNPEVGLMEKTSSLTAALGMTKFTTVIVILVKFYCGA